MNRDLKASLLGLLAAGFGPIAAVLILGIVQQISFADFTNALIVAIIFGYPIALVWTAIGGLPLLLIARKWRVMNPWIAVAAGLIEGSVLNWFGWGHEIDPLWTLSGGMSAFLLFVVFTHVQMGQLPTPPSVTSASSPHC